jgi:hypothetical protein
MSNQVGDRYVCSDPNCGCEVEIERPCSMNSAEVDVSESSSVKTRDFRAQPTSTVRDYGSGTVGKTGVGDRSATASNRYKTETTRIREEAADTLICFCGARMREVGSGRRAQASRAGSNT